VGKEPRWRRCLPRYASQEYRWRSRRIQVEKYKTYRESLLHHGREQNRQLLLDMLDFFRSVPETGYSVKEYASFQFRRAVSLRGSRNNNKPWFEAHRTDFGAQSATDARP